jgi:hypothetical protein
MPGSRNAGGPTRARRSQGRSAPNRSAIPARTRWRGKAARRRQPDWRAAARSGRRRPGASGPAARRQRSGGSGRPVRARRRPQRAGTGSALRPRRSPAGSPGGRNRRDFARRMFLTGAQSGGRVEVGARSRDVVRASPGRQAPRRFTRNMASGPDLVIQARPPHSKTRPDAGRWPAAGRRPEPVDGGGRA